MGFLKNLGIITAILCGINMLGYFLFRLMDFIERVSGSPITAVIILFGVLAILAALAITLAEAKP